MREILAQGRRSQVKLCQDYRSDIGNFTLAKSTTLFEKRLLAPSHWPTWLLLAGAGLLAKLPLTEQRRIGQGLGKLMQLLLKRRKHIAATNLRICFPELDETAHQQLLTDHFRSLGMIVPELALCWFGSERVLRKMGRLDGIEHLQAGLSRGKGVILYGAHYTTLEISGSFLALFSPAPIQVTYRPHENALFDKFVRLKRESRFENVIARDDIRSMVRGLKQNKVVWIATDQNFGHKSSVFAPFFNVPAATNTAVARLANLTGAAVIPFSSLRLDPELRYVLTLSSPLENFPSGDMLLDAARLNAVIEERVRLCPAQYLWVHRRFKDRPPGQPNIYAAT